MLLRQRFTRRRPHAQDAFTIIEVLIVVAIAAVILMMVFLVVPTAQRSARNYSRKQAVDAIAAQLVDYNTVTGHLPSTAAEGDDFINGYVPQYKGRFDITFHALDGDHAYFPDLDTIAIQYAHWCNKYGDGDNSSDPIAGTDENPRLYVVWTELEPDSVSYHQTYCVDNLGKTAS